jgi:hypothetical protein
MNVANNQLGRLSQPTGVQDISKCYIAHIQCQKAMLRNKEALHPALYALYAQPSLLLSQSLYTPVTQLHCNSVALA